MMPTLSSLAQDLPHSVKLLQHNLQRQDSNFPGQEELSWAARTRDINTRETPRTSLFFLLLLLSSHGSTALQWPCNDSALAFA